METWQRARQGELSCLHTPISELCNAILNTCQMPSRFYIIPSNVNKSQTHLLKPFLGRTCCHCHLAVKNPIHDGKRGQLKLPKKVMNGTTMWSCDIELCTNGVEATKCWVFVAHFSIYSTSRCRCHAGTDIPRLRGHTLQINQVVRTVRHRISCCAPTIHWKCDAQIRGPALPLFSCISCIFLYSNLPPVFSCIFIKNAANSYFSCISGNDLNRSHCHFFAPM